MNEHITAWIDAYHDGELHGARLRQVEAHLEVCPSCRAELDALRSLSTLLQTSPSMTPCISARTCAAQVNLRLPRSMPQPAWRKALKTGWQLAPLGLVVAWAFFQAVLLATDLVLRANLERYLTPSLSASPASLAPLGFWQGLGNLLSLPGEDLLNLAFSVHMPGIPVTLPGGMVYMNIGVTILFAVLLWSWLASWWAHRQRQQPIV
jgi:Putative zinc-finger